MRREPDPKNYPKHPGRQWMLWALEALGDADGGTSEELADRLALHGFDVVPPEVTHPSRPYPTNPTDGWVRETLRYLGHNPREMSDVEKFRALHAAGFTMVQR
jgi:hypothetical protein